MEMRKVFTFKKTMDRDLGGSVRSGQKSNFGFFLKPFFRMLHYVAIRYHIKGKFLSVLHNFVRSLQGNI